jgi:hypothetical protein
MVILLEPGGRDDVVRLVVHRRSHHPIFNTPIGVHGQWHRYSLVFQDDWWGHRSRKVRRES